MSRFKILPQKYPKHAHSTTAVDCMARRTFCFAEALVMDDLAFSEEFEYVAHVPIVDEAEQIVVGYARFLFCCRPVNTTKRGRIRTANVSPPGSRRRLSCAIQRSILPWQVLPPA